MNRPLSILCFTILALLLTFSGASAGNVAGEITENTSWRLAESPYTVTDNITVAAGATLTIEPGVVVKFGDNIGMWVNGTLSAVGTANLPIIFTGTTEAPDWWRFINIQEAGSAALDWCDIGYAGYYENAGILKTGTGALILKNSKIHHHNGDGLRIAAGYSEFTSAGNAFYNQNFGVRLGINASFDDNTSDFHDNNKDVHVDGGGITQDTVWNLKKDYSLFVSGDITVGPNATLTVKPGTVVKFADNVGMWVTGALKAEGTSASPVYFTDLRDDSVGGDANDDGNASAPAAEWWRFINIYGAGSATLNWCHLRYGGYYEGLGIVKTGTGALSMSDSFVSHTRGSGLRIIDNTGESRLTRCAFQNNSDSGLQLLSSPLTVVSCKFQNNGAYGVYQESNDSFDYTGNTFAGNTLGGVGVGGGAITRAITWKPDGNPFVVVGDLTIAEGAALTVMPGVVVKFNDNIGIWVNGVISALGTQASPITFTGTTEAPDWWRFINIQNAGSGAFDWCDIGYGGYYEHAGILKSGTGSLSLKNSKIHHHSGDGLRIGAGYSEFISTGNAFYNQNFGVRLGINASFDDNTSDFHDNNKDLHVDGGSITTPTVWNLKKDYSLFVSGDITVQPGATLTVKPGTVVKLADNVGIWVDGALIARGSSANPIYFTDLRDDTVGGDANDDGDLSAPGSDWWRHIQIRQSGSASLDWCHVRYGGYYEGLGFYKTGTGDLTVGHSTISNTRGVGMKVENSTGLVDIFQTTFEANSGSGLWMKASPSVATDCVFQNNGGYGVYQESNDSFDYTGNTFAGNTLGGVGVGGGTISRNITWQADGSPFCVMGDLTIAEGATLTVMPGAKVQFGDNIGIWVNGAISAKGTPTLPITFTGTTEAPDWWRFINIQNAGSGAFDWCDIGYGGYYDHAGILKTGTGALVLKNSKIHHHNGDGLRIAAGYSEFTSVGNAFYNQNFGVRLGINASLDDNTSDFHDNNRDVYVDGGDITQDTVWNLKKDYSLFVSGDITVGLNANLTVKPGTVVKFADNVGIWVDGVFTAMGSSADPIYFTDLRDDAVGGDANDDANASAPGPDWWRFIHVRDTGSASFDWCHVRYAGYYEGIGVFKTGTGDFTLKNTTISSNRGDGLRIQGSTGQHELSRNAFTGNNVGLRILNQTDSVMVSGSRFEGNAAFGVLNENSAEVDARSNWWGDETGPKHATNPDGEGDAVSDGVLFDPWRITPSMSEILSPLRSGAILEGDALRFSGAGPEDPTVDFFWEFGDGRAASGKTPGIVNFPAPGVHNIAFGMVQNGIEDAYPDTRVITVLGAAGTYPDLEVSGVDLPGNLEVGQPANITYSARNIGDGPMAGASWKDALYLSSDEFLDTADTRLGEAMVQQEVPPGASYNGAIQVTLPPTGEGSWQFILSLNDEWQVLERRRLNNEKAASVTILIPELQSDTERTVDYLPGRVEQYFRMTSEGGKNLVLNLGDEAAGLEVYVRYGDIPTRNVFDFRASDEGLTIPSATAGNWYILVYGSMDQGGRYAIEYTLTDVTLTSVTPNRFTTLSDLDMSLTGAGFVTGLQVELIPEAGDPIGAQTVEVDSFTQAVAHFPAGAIPAGTYAVRVTRSGQTDALASALTVVEGGKAKFETKLILPSWLGYHLLSTIYVEYANTGDAPMPAPLLHVTATQKGKTGAIMTLDQTRLSSGFWTSAMPEGFANSVQFLASGENPGILEPGESRRVPVYYAGWQQPWDMSYPPFDWAVNVLDADNTTPVNWDTLKDGMRPSYIQADAWDVVFANFIADAGDTWGDYVAMLSKNAVYLNRLGQRAADITPLLALSFRKADGMSPLSALSQGVDATVEAPGMAIVFERMFLQPISRRFEIGTLGRGWTHNWRYRLTKETDGTVEITDMTGTPRIFQPDSRYAGRFVAQPGDQGSLRVSGDGYLLTEPDGMIRFFDQAGKLIYREDTNGNRITCEYEGDLLKSLTHSADPLLKLRFDYEGNFIKTITDPVGRLTTYEYDGQYLASITTHDGQVTTFDYQKTEGSPARHALTRMTPPEAARRYFTYDDQGRLQSIHRGADAEKYVFTYSDGRVDATDLFNQTSRFYFDHAGRLVKGENALGEAVRLVYDDLGNLTSITDPAGMAVTFAYDKKGNCTLITDAMRRTYQLSYTRELNRLASLIDPEGNSTVYKYDAKGNLVETVYPGGGKETWGFDEHGNPTAWTNRRGTAVSYDYDNQGRIQEKRFGDGSVATYTYDARGNLKTAENAQGVTTFSYNEKDYPIKVDYPDNRYLEFEYDIAGRRTISRDQLGYVVQYQYDEAGRLSRLTDANNAPIVIYDYDEMGRLIKKTTGNGVYTVYTHDAAGRVKTLVNHKPDNTVLSRFESTYDSRGRRTAMTTHYGTWSYTYDDLGQLTRAVLTSTSPEIENQELSYEYDALGNRVKTVANGQTENYDANALNQYVQAGDRTYTYDADGNLTQETGPDGVILYDYDDENQLVGVTKGTDAWEYGYDALGNRVRVDKNGVTTHHVFDPAGLGNMVGEYAADNSLVARYDYGMGLLRRMTPNGAADDYVFDPMGDTSQTCGPAGAVKNAYVHQPFGGLMWQSQTVPNPFQFAGEFGVMSDASGLHYMRARYYDSKIGRFTAPDPIGLAGGDANLYRYVMNSPLHLVDPMGLKCDSGAGSDIFNQMEAEEARRNRGANIHKDPELASEYSKGGWGYTLNFIGMGITGYSTYLLVTFPASAPVTAPAAFVGFVVGVAPDVYNWYNSKPKPSGQNTGFCGHSNKPVTPPTPPGGTGANGASKGAGSGDPNEKKAIAGGYGAANYVDGNRLITYRVDFENMSSATAPAQFVTVRDQLSDKLDWSTFELMEVGFGNVVIPAGGPAYMDHVENYDYTDEEYDFTINVQVQVEFNKATGLLEAVFTSLDPETELPPKDVNVGFLMPEKEIGENGKTATLGRGHGYVSFAVRPKPGMATNAEIRNIATIQFDMGATIDTNQVDPLDPEKGTDPNKEALVTFDTSAPASRVQALAGKVHGTFQVSWEGEDEGAGIAGYDVYVRENNGDWAPWLSNTTDTEAEYPGISGSTYAFYCVAVDNAGNREEKPASPETTTQNFPIGDVNQDGHVNLKDAVLVAKVLAGIEIAPETATKDADVNGDDKLEMADLIYIIGYVSGIMVMD